MTPKKYKNLQNTWCFWRKMLEKYSQLFSKIFSQIFLDFGQKWLILHHFWKLEKQILPNWKNWVVGPVKQGFLFSCTYGKHAIWDLWIQFVNGITLKFYCWSSDEETCPEESQERPSVLSCGVKFLPVLLWLWPFLHQSSSFLLQIETWVLCFCGSMCILWLSHHLGVFSFCIGLHFVRKFCSYHQKKSYC